VDHKHPGHQLPDATNPEMIYIKLPVGLLQCNCCIIGDPTTREAVVIDPGDEVERILDLIGRYKLQVKAIVSTHAHIDHVGGLAKLYQYTAAPVMMHSDDLPLYRGMEAQAAFLGMRPPELVEVHQLLREGDVLQWGGFLANVIHTPGHTPGSVSLYLPKRDGNGKDASNFTQPQLFAGDTLFAGSIGRTDLWGGSYEQILESLKGKLLQLPDTTVVHPGHGHSTTIGHERETNPFLK
jgi:glyoxylase-like metal-dependent hydrolase (beta-lactamase superfamily II)